MIVENKPQKIVTHYGRKCLDLPNCLKVKTTVARHKEINPKGRQNVQRELIACKELFLQVIYNSKQGDNAPYIYLIEVTDFDHSRHLIGRFSIKNKYEQSPIDHPNYTAKIVPILGGVIWFSLNDEALFIIKNHYPELETLEALDKIQPAAIELTRSIPDKVILDQPKLPKKARKLYKECGIFQYSTPIARVHIKQPDTRQGRF